MLKFPLLFIDPDGIISRMRIRHAAPGVDPGYAYERLRCPHGLRECSSRCAALFVDIDESVAHLSCCGGSGARRLGVLDGERMDHDWYDDMTWGSRLVEDRK